VFALSSARRKLATFPSRPFLLNSLTGLMEIIFPMIFARFIPWTSSEILRRSWSKFIPNSAATI